MRIVNLLINENVAAAKVALNKSGADDVIDRCVAYLESLKGYREQLFKLKELPELDNRNQSSFAVEMVSQARAAVRAAIEITVSETSRTEGLLASFTSVSIYDAAETLNTFRYEGSNNWEAGPVGLRYSNGFVSGFIPIVEALEIASRLRREAYELLNRAAESATKRIDP